MSQTTEDMVRKCFNEFGMRQEFLNYLVRRDFRRIARAARKFMRMEQAEKTKNRKIQFKKGDDEKISRRWCVC